METKIKNVYLCMANETDITELLEDVGQWVVIGSVEVEVLQWEFIFYHEKLN